MLSRDLSECFYLVIPLNNESVDVNQLLIDSLLVEQSTDKLLKGLITPEEYFEIVESTDIDIDDYIDEIENNVIDAIDSTNELTNEQKGIILYGF